MSVILINPFEVLKGPEDEALKDWEAAEYLRRQPGHISTKLHQAIAPGAKFHFINMAEWESPAAFHTAITSKEFQELTKHLVENFPHYPALYTVIRE